MSLKVKGIALFEKKLMVINPFPDVNSEYRCFSEGKYLHITNEDREELISKPRTSEFLLVSFEIGYCVKVSEDEFRKGTMEEYYNEIIADAKALKLATKGKINMFKTGGYSKTAMKYLFDLMNDNEILPESIDDYETRFLMDAGGAFRLAQPYEGKMYKYDSRSYYASIYSSSKLLIPIKKGILRTITTKELNEMKFFEGGVYHCKIEIPKGSLKKLIWVNPSNYYTHYELTYFREKGLKLQMIEEKDNFLHYPRSHCKTGSEIFGEFTKTLFELKEVNKISGAKKLLNHVWGALTKKNKKVVIHKITDPPLEDDAYEMIPIDDETFEVTYLREKKFEYEMARMKPFFLAKCRLTMAKTIEPHVSHIFYSHTDSIISDIPLEFKDNKKLGDFKYEGCCEEGFIKNGMSRTQNKHFSI